MLIYWIETMHTIKVNAKNKNKISFNSTCLECVHKKFTFSESQSMVKSLRVRVYSTYFDCWHILLVLKSILCLPKNTFKKFILGQEKSFF